VYVVTWQSVIKRPFWGGLTFTDAVDRVANRVRNALGSITKGIDHAAEDATCAEKWVRDGEI
jgi:hypothetical protein